MENGIEITPPKENKMGVMPINRLLLSMSVPMMLSMLVQALYNIVDSIFVAQIGENALAGISLAFPVQNLMIAVGAGTGVGINALLSRSLGEKKFARANATAVNGIFLALLSSLAFAVFGLVGAEAFFRLQTNIPEIVGYGRDYLWVCMVFSFGLFGQITLKDSFSPRGEPFIP